MYLKEYLKQNHQNNREKSNCPNKHSVTGRLISGYLPKNSKIK